MGWEEILLRLGTAAIIGSVIGINREIHHKSAGFRTIAIVCVGTALAVLVAPMGGDNASASRVFQGVVTGIGFLGAGVIVHHSRQPETVEGLTTAASIWTAAGLGAACGMGDWAPALIGGVLIVGLLAIGGRVETAMRKRFG
jgi:putative Mg2+ transporter-C (MgtC) family protein